MCWSGVKRLFWEFEGFDDVKSTLVLDSATHTKLSVDGRVVNNTGAIYVII